MRSGTIFRDRLAAAAPDLIPAKVLFDEIRERGYGGGYTMVKVFVVELHRLRGQLRAYRLKPLFGGAFEIDG